MSGCGGQQRVSLAQTLQLRYSSLLPSGIVLEHFEKTGHGSITLRRAQVTSNYSPVHIPNKFSTFRGSISCIRSTFSCKTGAESILVFWCPRVGRRKICELARQVHLRSSRSKSGLNELRKPQWAGARSLIDFCPVCESASRRTISVMSDEETECRTSGLAHK